METYEWLVAAFLLGAGLLAAIGLFWGNQDPTVANYKPGIGGMFTIGRIRARRDERDRRQQNDSGSQSEST
jgi:hypothetical protein